MRLLKRDQTFFFQSGRSHNSFYLSRLMIQFAIIQATKRHFRALTESLCSEQFLSHEPRLPSPYHTNTTLDNINFKFNKASSGIRKHPFFSFPTKSNIHYSRGCFFAAGQPPGILLQENSPTYLYFNVRMDARDRTQ